MKKFAILLSAFACVSGAFAQLNGDGFYRVLNGKTNRYAYLTDNKSWMNTATSSINVGAIELWRGFERAASDPASVIYIEKHGSQYDIQAQGSGIYAMSGYYVNIIPSNYKDGTYFCYGSVSGVVRYLGDDEDSMAMEDGYCSSTATGEYRKWYILPVTQEPERYFGIKPTLEVNGKYYNSFFADFSFAFTGQGMKAYYIQKIDADFGMAVLAEVSSDYVPRSTPIFIECTSPNPVDNKLDIKKVDVANVSGNMLKGVYFNNSSRTHNNQTAYDPATMRVLGTMEDGSLGFVTAQIDFIPANSSYLSVPEGTPAELKVVTLEEYTTGISSVSQDEAHATEIFDLNGVKVSEATENLKPGVYVRRSNGGARKFIVR